MDSSDRKRKLLIIVFRVIMVFLTATFVILWVSRWNPKESRPISGTVVGYKRINSQTGGPPVLVVNLSSDKQVLVPIGYDVPVHTGARVVLTETKTWPFGFRFYGFVGYDALTGTPPPESHTARSTAHPAP